MGNYFYNFALNPNAKDGFGTAAGIEDNEYTRWLLADSEDVYLDSFDGLKLHAYRVDGTAPHRYAILCHGYQNNARDVFLCPTFLRCGIHGPPSGCERTRGK